MLPHPQPCSDEQQRIWTKRSPPLERPSKTKGFGCQSVPAPSPPPHTPCAWRNSDSCNSLHWNPSDLIKGGSKQHHQIQNQKETTEVWSNALFQVLRRAFLLHFLTTGSKQQQQIWGTVLPSANQGKRDRYHSSLSAPWLPRSILAAHIPQARQGEACSLRQRGGHRRAPHRSSCLLGISWAPVGGLGAVMLLNTAISKSELYIYIKHMKSALRTGDFFIF